MPICDVLLTVDVEFSTRVYRAGVPEAEHLGWFIFGACGRGDYGISYQLRALAERGLKAVFFVDAFAGVTMGRRALARVVEPILNAGQDVQLHIHPEWLDDFPHSPVDGACGQYMWQFTRDQQRVLIEIGCEQLVAVGAPRPTAFRAGNFGADKSTLEALAACGIRFDSSFNGGIRGGASRIDLPRARLDPVRFGDVVELPVTVIRDRAEGYRHAQLCALSAWEMRAALGHAARSGQRLFTALLHSFELLARSRAQPNGTHVRRFHALLDHLAAHPAKFATRHIADLDVAHLLSGQDPAPLPVHAPRRAHRLAAQAWGHLRYERFGPPLSLPRFEYVEPPGAADIPPPYVRAPSTPAAAAG